MNAEKIILRSLIDPLAGLGPVCVNADYCVIRSWEPLNKNPYPPAADNKLFDFFPQHCKGASGRKQKTPWHCVPGGFC
jgi:hypothetical protein